jgi:hypothetical protein
VVRAVWGTARDGAGNVIQSGNVTAYVHGSTTPSTIYTDSGATLPVSSVTTNALDGSFIFYVSDTGLVLYDVQIAGTGLVTKLYTYINPVAIAAGGLPVTTGTPTSINGMIKGNGTTISLAVATVDFAPVTTGSAVLKASSGGFANATAGTDFCGITTGTGILKASSGNTAAATSSDLALLYPAIINKSASFTLDLGYAFSTVNITSTAAIAINCGVASNFPTGTWIDFVAVGGANTITLSGIINNWWNSASIGTSFVMGRKCRIWSDGTYWYASPINIGIALSANNALNNTSQTSWTSLSIASFVPAFARSITGYFLGSSTYQAWISNTSAGYNAISAGNGQAVSFVDYAILTPQTIWYQNAASGATYITITGWGC